MIKCEQRNTETCSVSKGCRDNLLFVKGLSLRNLTCEWERDSIDSVMNVIWSEILIYCRHRLMSSVKRSVFLQRPRHTCVNTQRVIKLWNIFLHVKKYLYLTGLWSRYFHLPGGLRWWLCKENRHFFPRTLIYFCYSIIPAGSRYYKFLNP